MPIQISCNNCKKKYEMSDEIITGRTADLHIQCPGCKAEIMVPSAQSNAIPMTDAANKDSNKIDSDELDRLFDLGADASEEKPSSQQNLNQEANGASEAPTNTDNAEAVTVPPTTPSPTPAPTEEQKAQDPIASAEEISDSLFDPDKLFEDISKEGQIEEEITKPPKPAVTFSERSENSVAKVERKAPEAQLFDGLSNDSDLLNNDFVNFYGDEKHASIPGKETNSASMETANTEQSDIFAEIADELTGERSSQDMPDEANEIDTSYISVSKTKEQITVSEPLAPPTSQAAPIDASALFDCDSVAKPSETASPDEFVSQLDQSEEIPLKKKRSLGAAFRRAALLCIPTLFVIASSSIILHLMKREEGLFGKRLVGFHLEKAYRSPTAEELKNIDQLIRNAFDVFKTGLPEGLAESARKLDQILLQLDERSAKALSRSICFASMALPYISERMWIQQKMASQDSLLATYAAGSADQMLATTCKQFASGKFADVAAQIETDLFNRFKDDPFVLTLYGFALLQSGNSGKAKEALESVARADPRNLIAVEGLARATYELNDLESTIKFARFLINRNPNHSRARLILSRAQTSQGVPPIEIEAELSKLTSGEQPGEIKSEAFVIIAAAYEKSGDVVKHIAYLEKAAQANSKDAALLKKLGMELLHKREIRNISKAVEFLQKSLLLRSEDVETQILLTEAAFRTGDLTQASNTISKAVEKSPKNPDIQFWLGHVYFALGKYPESEKAFKEMSTIDEKDARAYAMLGRVALKTKTPAEADPYFKKALDLDPNSIFVQTANAEFMCAQKKYQIALAVYERVLEKDPLNREALIGAVQTQIRLDNLTEAAEPLSRLEKSEPNDLEVMQLQARYAMIKEDETAAQAAILKMGLSAKDKRTVFTQAAFLIQTGKIASAKTLLEQVPEVLELDPEYSYLKAELTEKLVESETRLTTEIVTYEGALEFLKKSLAVDPKNEDYLFLESRLLYKANDLKLAEKKIQRLIEINPYYRWAYLLYGDILLATNRPEAAAKQYEVAESLFPKKGPIFVKIGKTYEKINQYTKAASYYKKAAKADPINPEHSLALGLLYNKMDQFAVAAEYFKEAIKKNPRQPEPYFYLGYIYKSYQKFEPSLKAFQRYLALAPESQSAGQVQEEVFFLKRSLSQRVQ